MKTVTIQYFGNGMVNNIYGGGVGEFSVAKGFDVLTYPNRLFPLPSMQTATSGTLIGNMMVGLDGLVYGSGKETPNPTKGNIWKATAGSATWTELGNAASGELIDYSLLVHYKENDATEDILYSCTTGIRSIESSNVTTGSTHALTYSTMCQGYVHPVDNIMYFGYTTSTTSCIGRNNASVYTDVALALPRRYRPIGLTKYGDYLAIGCTSFASGAIPGSGIDTSVVYLWARDISLTTIQETIQWGDDCLQILNNLDGALIGVSKIESNTASGFSIKVYAGGQVQTVKEILINSASTTITINQGVNYIHKHRLYFSVDVPGSGTSPVYKGLWSIGRNESGRWTLNLERITTTDGSMGSCITAVQAIDYLHTATGAAGTMTTQFSGSTKSTDYVNPSIYESTINPGMPDEDKIFKKKLVSVACHYLPLPTTGQVIMKYRVDSDGGAWTTIVTETADGVAFTEMPSAAGTSFTDGRNYEFRIESTGYAQITGFSYKYDILKTNI